MTSQNHWHILQHQDHEGPGHLKTWATSLGVALTVVRIDLGEPVPKAADVQRLIVLGGPMSVHDPLPFLEAERQLIRTLLKEGRYVLGLCLGAQQLAAASGAGAVVKMGYREIGYHPVRKSADGSKILGTVWPDSLSVMHWHEEEITLAADAVSLLCSDACAVQGFLTACGFGLGLQFHPEITPAELSIILVENAQDLAQTSPSVHSARQIQEAMHSISGPSWQVVRQLLDLFFAGSLRANVKAL